MYSNQTKVMFIVTVIKLLVVSSGMNELNNITLIVSVPFNDCITISQDINLNKGLSQEILSAAQVAVDGINNDSSILPDSHLQLILLDSCKHKNEILQQFVEITYYQSPQIVHGITGFFSLEAVSLLLPLVKHKRIVLTSPSEVYVYRSQGRSILTTNSPPTMANVLLTFVKRMNWERFGLITESKDSYFFNVAASLLQTAKENKTLIISPYIELQRLESAIHEIVSYNTKVIIVCLPTQKIAQMISLIDRMGLLWPDYAWILLKDGVFDHPETYKAIRGIFIIESQVKPDQLEKKLISSFTFCELDHSSLTESANKKISFLKHDALVKIMFDLVLLTALKLRNNCTDIVNQVNTQEPSSHEIIQYKNDTIFSILHIWGQSKVLTGIVYSNFSITIVNKTVLEAAAPIDDLPVISIDPPIGYTVGMASLIVLLAVFVTLTLLLYLCFRKEPEVKATSFTISLFLFAGCYFNLLYIILIVYFEHPAFNARSTKHQNTVCNLFLWFSGTGISMPLMLATLLVKLMRVYHIFNYITLRIGHYCSDLALTIYILIILAPNIIVNLIWFFVDQYHAVIEFKARKGYVQLSKDCDSKYTSVWIGVLCAYLLLLAIASAVVAIMTRKVRMQHFKDTKKVNILVFSLCLGIIVIFSYWLLLQLLNTKTFIISLPFIIGHSLLILVFLSLLFIPKVFPPFWRYINCNRSSTSVAVCKSST